jgi:GH25 family lysozyme M1 (1,4-beta-N-acetylmuramidase)
MSQDSSDVQKATRLRENAVSQFNSAVEAFMSSARSGVRPPIYTEPWVHHYKNRLNNMREAYGWLVDASKIAPTIVSPGEIEEWEKIIKQLSKAAGA